MSIHEESSKNELIVITIVRGEIAANVIKSHLESEGVPVFLKYESIGRILGLNINGLGQVEIMVPRGLAKEAMHIIYPGQVGIEE